MFYDSLASNLKGLDIIIPPTAYPKGAVLFMEGQTARGIFAVCGGKVKLFTASREGKTIILKVELLGLPATLSDKPYEMTAEVSEPAWVNFVPRSSFLRFLQANPAAAIQVAQHLMNSPSTRTMK
jgi:CRP/FNR family transcriptional regulator, cyclic AMP receptor protein